MIDVEAERVKIKEHLKGLLAAENRNDVEGALQFYGRGSYFIAPGMELKKGHDALRAILKGVLETIAANRHEYVDVQVSESGDLGYAIAHYHLTIKDSDFEFPTSGKFLSVLRKKQGEWKIMALCFNGDE